jgi:hypothetical protein
VIDHKFLVLVEDDVLKQYQEELDEAKLFQLVENQPDMHQFTNIKLLHNHILDCVQLNIDTNDRRRHILRVKPPERRVRMNYV